MEENIEKWRKAGKITSEAREYGRGLVRKGASMKDVCDKIDAKIEELGAKPAFPSQTSCDHIAAHFCVDDEDVIFENQVVKLDVGANVDGFLGDSAVTIDLSGQHTDLVKASAEALQAAIDIVKEGVALREIGKAIQDVITGYDLAPIRNLSGHGLDRYEIHTAPTVPNFDNGDENRLSDNQIIAIEPFATSGKGIIYEAGTPTVFMFRQKKPVRDMMTRKVLAEIEKYKGVPFAKRHLALLFPRMRLNMALTQMTALNILEKFPPLVEREKGLVSQAEHTILVQEDGCEVLTK